MLGSPSVSSGTFRSQVKSHITRESRFEARSRRRYGDWSILDVPTVLLWIDDDDALDSENECQC